MLYIQNTGAHGDPDMAGVWNYELRDNHAVLATFRHRRSDGLAECLRAAARAVDEAKERANLEMLRRLRHEVEK